MYMVAYRSPHFSPCVNSSLALEENKEPNTLPLLPVLRYIYPSQSCLVYGIVFPTLYTAQLYIIYILYLCMYILYLYLYLISISISISISIYIYYIHNIYIYYIHNISISYMLTESPKISPFSTLQRHLQLHRGHRCDRGQRGGQRHRRLDRAPRDEGWCRVGDPTGDAMGCHGFLKKPPQNPQMNPENMGDTLW